MNTYNHPMSEAWESLVEVLIAKTQSLVLEWYHVGFSDHGGYSVLCMEPLADPPAVWIFSQLCVGRAFCYTLERYQEAKRWSMRHCIEARLSDDVFVRLFDTIVFHPEARRQERDTRGVKGLLDLKRNLQKL